MIRRWRERQQQRAQFAFLPAALSILHTPASPARFLLSGLICLFVVSALLWSILGHTDIIATASGKLQPRGQVKVVQPSIAGRVTTIHVENGQPVLQGELLVTLDGIQAGADVAAFSAQREALQGEMARRRAALATARQWQSVDLWSTTLSVPSSLPSTEGPLSSRVHAHAWQTYHGDVQRLRATLMQLTAQYRQKQTEITSLEHTIKALQTQLQSKQQLVGLYASQVASRGVSQARLLRERGEQEETQVSLAQHTGQLAEARSALAVIEGDAAVTFETFIADNAQQLEVAIQRHDEVEQQWIKAQHALAAMTLTSPIDGMVQALSLTTPGQFVQAGTELMRIVPRGAPLEVIAYLSNQDVGFVEPGQEATLKVQAFPFTRYGLIEGEVIEVASDAITDTEAQQQANNDAAQGPRSLVTTGQTQTVQGLVFPITVQPRVASLEVDGRTVPLSSGMAVQVEIKTGRRRLIDFLFSPLVEVASRAMTGR